MATPAFENYWNAILKELPSEHRHILRSTLPTPSFRLLLDSFIREQEQKLQNISTERSDEEFKRQYLLVKQRGELASDLLEFVKTLVIQPT